MLRQSSEENPYLRYIDLSPKHQNNQQWSERYKENQKNISLDSQPERGLQEGGSNQQCLMILESQAKSRDVFTEFDSKELKGDFEENGFYKG